MPNQLGGNIENEESNEKKGKRSRAFRRITDSDIRKLLDEESKKAKSEDNEIETRSSGEIKHEVFHLVQHLREMEIRLSEHYEIAAFQARFSAPDKRRMHIFTERSVIREELSRNLRILIEQGLSEADIQDEMPFIPKGQIKGLILNEP